MYAQCFIYSINTFHIEYIPAKVTILISNSNQYPLWRRIDWDFTDQISQIVWLYPIYWYYQNNHLLLITSSLNKVLVFSSSLSTIRNISRTLLTGVSLLVFELSFFLNLFHRYFYVIVKHKNASLGIYLMFLKGILCNYEYLHLFVKGWGV